MLLVCPSCATSYMIDPATIGAGRNVRCTRCRTQWFAAPARHGQPSVEAFVDDVMAEAEAGTRPPAQPAPPHLPAAPDIPPFNPAMDAAPPREATPVAAEPRSAEFAAPPIADAPSLVPPVEPAPMPEPATSPLPGPDNSDIESFAARRFGRKQRRAKRARSRWPLIIFALAAVNAAIIVFRADVVRLLPQTASLFSAIGLPVNLRGLTFEGVTVSKDTNDGVPVLVVDGRIVSTTDKPVEVPRMRFAVRNAAGQEIYSWTAQPPRSILAPGETMPFRSRLASPPAEANSVLVRFATARDAMPGTK